MVCPLTFYAQTATDNNLFVHFCPVRCDSDIFIQASPKQYMIMLLFFLVDVPDGHDSGYIPDHMREAGGDSGLSTPDPTKPKKVIYEVIV